jgi:hypothetical protein
MITDEAITPEHYRAEKGCASLHPGGTVDDNRHHGEARRNGKIIDIATAQAIDRAAKADAEAKRTVGSLKLSWEELVIGDPTIDHATYRVGSCIAHVLSQGSRRAVISIQAIADIARVSPTQVKQGIRKLRTGGWLGRRRTRNANIYELLFPQAKINCILDWRIQCREQRAEARKERRRTMR